MFKTKIQKIIASEYFPFVILALGMLAIHMLFRLNSGDDKVFATVLNNTNLSSYLTSRYLTWTSRLVIESVLVMFFRLPLIVWRITNTAVIVLLGVTISKLVVNENKKASNWLITFLLFVYPLSDMSTAGWVTTMMNNLWPLTFGLFSLILVKKAVLGQKILKLEYIVSVLALIYAANQEQMVMILLAIYLAATIYLVVVKKSNWFVFFGLALCIASIIFILTCPGNAVRQNIEVRWFEDFNHLSMIDKLEIGVSSTLAQYIFKPNLIFILFCTLIFISARIKYTDQMARVFSIIPIAAALLFGFFLPIAPNFFPGLTAIINQMTVHGLITLDNFTKIQSYLALIILYATICLVFISVYLIFENTWTSVFAVGILLLGFLSRIAVSFSPTIWASSTRTYIFMYGSIIICCVMLFQHIVKSGSVRFTDKFLTFAGFIAGISYLNLLMTL